MKYFILIILTILAFSSCKKDPVEKAKSDLFKKLKGTWILTDFSSSYGSIASLGDGQEMYSYTYSFSNNIVTCINIHKVDAYHYTSCDTTTTTYGFTKSLKFKEYSRDDYLSYTEYTTKSGVSTTIDHSANWSNLTIDNLIIKIETHGCKIVVDGSDNLILTYENNGSSMGGAWGENTKWTFRKI